MKANFESSLRHILAFEGGYVDHPNDPGGATNLGITRATLASHLGRAVSKAEVRALSRERARDIYRKLYWDALRCDEMPGGVDLALFDCGVNQGTGRAARLLQTALKVGVDGIIGPVTMRAVRSADPAPLLTEFVAQRMRAYGRLSSLFRTFGLGWSRRLIAVHSAAMALTSKGHDGANTPPHVPAEPETQDNEESLMTFMINRLREPSTYAGVAAFLAGIGLFGLGESEWNQIFGAVASVAGVLAMFMSDGPRSRENDSASDAPSQTGQPD